MPDIDYTNFPTATTSEPEDFYANFPTLGVEQSYQQDWEWRPIDRIVKSSRETGAALTGLFALGADALGAEGVRDTLLQKSSDMFENIENDYWSLATTEFKDAVTDPTDFLKFGTELITSYVPDLALMILAGAGAATGAAKASSTAVGKKIITDVTKKTLAKNLDGYLAKGLVGEAAQAAAIKSTAREIGQLGGMSLYEGALASGSGYLGDVERVGADEASPIAALGLGAATSAVSLLSPVNKMISSSFGQKVMTKKGLRDVAGMTIGEAGEEFGQELVAVAHEVGTDPNMTISEAMSNPDTAWRLAESGFSGFLLGGLFGGGSLGLSKMAKEKSVVDTELKDAGLDEENVDTLLATKLSSLPKLPEDIEREKSLAYLQEKNRKLSPQEKTLKAEEGEYNKYQPSIPNVDPIPFQAILEEVKPEAPAGFTRRIAMEIRDATTNEEVTELLADFGVPKRFIPQVVEEISQVKEASPVAVESTIETQAIPEVTELPEAPKTSIPKAESPLAINPYQTAEGGLATTEGVTLSPEDILTQETEAAPEIDSNEAIATATEATTNSLTKALLEGDQDSVTSILSKSMKKNREALFTEAGKEAVSLAQGNNLTDFIETNISEAYDANFKREGTRTDTQAKWKQELDTVYTGTIAGEQYIITEMDSNAKGKNWNTMKRVDGKWEPVGTYKSATQAKGAVDKLFAAKPTTTDAAALVSQLTKSNNKTIAALAKAVATLSANKLGDIKVQEDAGSNYYHDKLNRISITPESTDIIKFHEVSHSVTARELKKDKASQNILNDIRKTLKATLIKDGKITEDDIVAFRSDRTKYTGEVSEYLYALASIDELLAVGLTSPTLQATLKSIKAKSPSGRIKTLWDQIIAIIGKALGLSPMQYTQLDRLLATFADLAAQAPTEVKGKGKIYEYLAVGGDAATIDRGVLAQAAMLRDSGVSKEEVLKQTGWMWRKDGMLRHLVSTKDFKIDDIVLFNKMRDKGVLKTLNTVVAVNNDLSSVQDELIALREDISKLNDDLSEEISNQLREKLEKELEESQLEEMALAIKEAELKNELTEVDTKDVYSVDMKDYYDPNTEAAKAYSSILNNTKIVFFMDTDTGFLGNANYSKNPDVRHIIRINLLATRTDVNPTLIHEYQHLIQAHEGFALGTSPDWVEQNAASLMFDEFFQIIKKLGSKKAVEQMEILKGQAYAIQEKRLGELGEVDSGLLDDFAAMEFFGQVKKNEELRSLMYDPSNSAYSQIENLQEALYVDSDTKPVKHMAHKIYEAALGEMEAREAAEMMDATTEELRKHIPSDIYVTVDGESIPAIVIQSGDSGMSAASTGVVVGKGKGGTYFKTSAEDTTRKTITEAEYKRIKAENRKAAEKKLYDAGMAHASFGMSLRDKALSLGKATKKLTKQLFEGTYIRLKNISPKLGELLRRAEFQIARDESNWRHSVRSFIEGYRGMNGGDKLLLKHALINRSTELRDRVLDKYKLKDSWKGVEDVLKQIEERSIKIGLIHSGSNDYFPSRVVDFDLFMDVFYKSESNKEFGPFDYIVRQKEKTLGRPLTETEKATLMHESIMSGNYGSIPLPGAAKHRTVHYVPQEGLAAYADPIAALYSHITDMAESLNFRERLGSTNRKTTMLELNRIDKQIEAVEKKLTANLGDSALIAERGKLVEAFEAKREELVDAETDLLDSISNVTAHIADGKKQEEAKELIRARVKQKGVHGVLGNIRDISYMSVLANPMSALTQLADNAVTLFNEGPKYLFQAWGEAVPLFKDGGKDMISVGKLDLSRSTTEFSNSSTSRMLDLALHWSGLKGMDILGKEVSMRATLGKWTDVAKKGDFKKFSERWSEILGEDTKKTYDHLREGKQSEEVLFMVFNSLADRQPIALSQMPQAYLQGGQGRIFYMLRSFSLTFINMAVDSARTDWKKGNHKAAVLKTMYLFALMSMAGAGADELKEYFSGNDEAFSDNVKDNFIQLLMINKYALKKGEQADNAVTALVGGYLPPLRFADDAVTDLWAVTFGEKDLKLKTLRNVPVIGKWAYAHTDAGVEGQLYGSKDRIFSKVKAGTPASKMRSEISRHNKRAREIGATDMIITYDNLRKAVEKKRKKERK